MKIRSAQIGIKKNKNPHFQGFMAT